MILDSPTSLLHQGSPSSWIFATKGVLKSPGEFLEISLRGLMVKVSSFMKILPLKLMFVENFRATIQNPDVVQRWTTAGRRPGNDNGPRCLSHRSDQLDLPMKHREQQHPFGAPEAALLPQRHPGRHLMTEKILKLQLPSVT